MIYTGFGTLLIFMIFYIDLQGLYMQSLEPRKEESRESRLLSAVALEISNPHTEYRG